LNSVFIFLVLLNLSEIPVLLEDEEEDEDEADEEVTSPSARDLATDESVGLRTSTISSTTALIPPSAVGETVICRQDSLFCDERLPQSRTTTDPTNEDCGSFSNLNVSELDNQRGMKRRWNEAELCAINRAFKQCIVDKKMAPGHEIMSVQKSHLPQRSVAQIRVRLNNVILGKQKYFDNQ
jgi:hypothetical protein